MLKSLVSTFDGEKGFGRSVTEPDQCMSISEIMHRFAMGMPNSALVDGFYDEDDEDFEDDVTRNPDFNFLDAYLTEAELRAAEMYQNNQTDNTSEEHLESSGETKQNQGKDDVGLFADDSASTSQDS